jgi:MFS family permease
MGNDWCRPATNGSSMATPASGGNRSAVYSSLPAVAWSAVAWLWLAGGSNYLTRTTLTTMRGSIVQDIPMSDAQFGLLTSAFLWLYAIVGPFGGFLADRYSRRLVVIWSVVAWSSVTLVTTQVRTFESFLALRALLGISQAFYIPAAVALIIDYHLGPTRALASGIHLTGMVFGSMIGGLGAGWLSNTVGATLTRSSGSRTWGSRSCSISSCAIHRANTSLRPLPSAGFPRFALAMRCEALGARGRFIIWLRVKRCRAP